MPNRPKRDASAAGDPPDHAGAPTLDRGRRFLVRLSGSVGLVTLLASAALAGPTGCASGPNLSDEYGQTARENYELAVANFNDRDWEDAITYADFVRIRFPFSRYAVEAELLIARAEYALKNYVTAQDAFRQFLRLHPTHKHVRNGWVAYMVAVSAYMASPNSVPFLPPHYQRDQALLRETLVELDYFFDHHAGSEMEPLARELEADVKRRLLEHELYVARFHLDGDRPEAAIMRLEAAHDTYPGIGLDAEVLFLLGVTYLRIDEIELAREIFTELQMQHPDHHHGQQAKLYLKYMQERYGPADPNRPRPDRSPPVPTTPAQAKPEQFKDFRWRKEQRKKKREGKADEDEQTPTVPSDAGDAGAAEPEKKPAKGEKKPPAEAEKKPPAEAEKKPPAEAEKKPAGEEPPGE
ncbi:MAG: outer membrane protein assembly factor BamD [Myxococcales bacterium]|nr:outer membrane protein assembly factor BamD [Myxococcales bacterium]